MVYNIKKNINIQMKEIESIYRNIDKTLHVFFCSSGYRSWAASRLVLGQVSVAVLKSCWERSETRSKNVGRNVFLARKKWLLSQSQLRIYTKNQNALLKGVLV